MNVPDIWIENFLTIGKAHLQLKSKGLVLVQGKNEADSSANSNGAGKSSFPDALCWAGYGTTARGESGDEVVNNIVKKNCMVQFITEDEGVFHRVTRYRKHKTGKNRLTLEMSTDGGKTFTNDLTKGTDKLTQPLVNQVLGCSYDVFIAAIYAGQDAMPDLPSMTDKNLKVLVEESAGIDRIQRALELARKDYNAASQKHTEIVTKRDEQIRRLEDMTEELNIQKDEVKRWKQGNELEIKVKAEDAKKLAAEAAELEKTLNPSREEMLRDTLSELNAALDGRAAEEEKLRELAAIETKIDRECTAKEYALNTQKEVTRKLKQAHENLDNRIGEACSECGKPYTEHDLEDVKRLSMEKLREAARKIPQLQVELEAAARRKEDASLKLSIFRADMTDVSEVISAQRVSQSELDGINETKRKVSDLKGQVKSIIAQAKTLQAAENPHTQSVKRITANIEKQKAEIEEIEASLVEAKKQVKLLDSVVTVFGPTGVRAHILDSVTPYLNDRTSEYLSTLSDGNLSAIWSTLGKTAKGELRENFNIAVTNEKGAKRFAGLSGGEKRKVRLATAMALQDLVASRATKPMNIWIADEIDHALDVSGLERLMAILEKKAREKGTVLVISHNNLNDWIRDSVLVTKAENGISAITGALVA